MSSAAESAKRKRSDDGDRCAHVLSQTSESTNRRMQGDEQSKRKWTRLLLRELYDLGFTRAAACLEDEATVRVRSQAMDTLQNLILQHRWDDALRFVQQQEPCESGDGTGNLQMKSRAAGKEVALLLLKRKYVELLLQKQVSDALETFQRQILPFFQLSEDETQELAMLLLCDTPLQMERSICLPLKDSDLLDCIEERVSPDEVVPHGCLRRMVEWKDSSATQLPSFSQAASVDAKCIALLLKHTNEILDVSFSPNGKYLASTSRDGKIIVWAVTFPDEEDETTSEMALVVALQTLQCGQSASECLAWSPDSLSLLSGGSDDSNIIHLWDTLTGQCVRQFLHPALSVTIVRWLPNGRQFLSGSVEKSLVLWNIDDQASDDGASVAYQWGGRRALDLAVHPNGEKVFVLCSETELRVYNVVDKSDRLLLRADHLVSSIAMSPSGAFLSLNFIEHEELACFNIATDSIVSRQRGFKQKRYILRSCFAGGEDELVVSGSEDGGVHVWRRDDGTQLCVANTHSTVVNAVVAHPMYRNIIASVSDDETIRFWRLTA